jgi:hypothetical protein
VGPLTWSVDFALTYVLTGYACTARSAGLLLIISALAFGATLTGLVVALRATRERPASGNVDGIRADPTRFMAIAGVAVSGGFLLAIIAAAMPRLLIDPCA